MMPTKSAMSTKFDVFITLLYKRSKVINFVTLLGLSIVESLGLENILTNTFLARTISKLMIFVPLVTKFITTNGYLLITRGNF